MRRLSGPSAFLASDRVLADEPARLLEIDGEAEARLEHRIGVVDVVAVVAVALLHAQAGQRLEARVTKPERRARVDEAIVDVRRLLGGNVELVAELAEIRDAHAQRAREADVDLARGAERERRVGQVARSSAPARASRERGPWMLICA